MMPCRSAEDKPATCYPRYATASLASAFQGEATPSLHFWGARHASFHQWSFWGVDVQFPFSFEGCWTTHLPGAIVYVSWHF